MSRYTQEYMEKMKEFVIGEEMKLKRTKGEKAKPKDLGVGHLSEEAKGQDVKAGERVYAGATIKKASGVSGETREVLVTLIQMIDDYTPNLSNSELRYLVDLMLNHRHSLESAKNRIKEYKDRLSANPSTFIPFQINRR